MPSNCPQCGDAGRLERMARGHASCQTCAGAFVPLGGAFAALKRAGVDGARLEDLLTREGRRLKGCATCEDTFTSFPVLGEVLHACLPCQGVWSAAGALDRIAARAAQTTPALPPPAAAEPASAGFVAATLTAPLAAPASPQTAAEGAVADAPAAPLGARGPSSSKERPKPGKGSALKVYASQARSPVPKVLLALVVVCGAFFTWRFVASAQKTALGGDRSASFGGAPVKAEPVMIGERPATHFLAKVHDEELSAHYIAGAGLPEDGGGADQLLRELYGPQTTLTGGAKRLGELTILTATFTQDATTPRQGRVRAYFTKQDAWLLSASAADSGSFAQGPKAERFLSSLHAD